MVKFCWEGKFSTYFPTCQSRVQTKKVSYSCASPLSTYFLALSTREGATSLIGQSMRFIRSCFCRWLCYCAFNRNDTTHAFCSLPAPWAVGSAHSLPFELPWAHQLEKDSLICPLGKAYPSPLLSDEQTGWACWPGLEPNPLATNTPLVGV